MRLSIEQRKVTLTLQVPAGATHYEPDDKGVFCWWKYDAESDQWSYTFDASRPWNPFYDPANCVNRYVVLPLTFAD
jgi:hypothetical protein